MMLKTIATLDYKVSRLPLTLLERNVVPRLLKEESPARLAFEKALGSLDSRVGKLIGNTELASRGSSQVRKATVLTKAAELEEKAEIRRENAHAAAEQAKKVAEKQRQDAAKNAQAATADIAEQKLRDTAAAQQQAAAEAQAKSRAISVEKERRVSSADALLTTQLDTIDATTQARTKAPKEQLKAAADLTDLAKKQKAKADRLAELTEAEKAARKAE